MDWDGTVYQDEDFITDGCMLLLKEACDPSILYKLTIKPKRPRHTIPPEKVRNLWEDSIRICRVNLLFLEHTEAIEIIRVSAVIYKYKTKQSFIKFDAEKLELLLMATGFDSLKGIMGKPSKQALALVDGNPCALIMPRFPY